MRLGYSQTLGSTHKTVATCLFHLSSHVVPIQVVFEEGIFVRSNPDIYEGRIVRIAPFGTVLKATGMVRNTGNAVRCARCVFIFLIAGWALATVADSTTAPVISWLLGSEG